MFYHHSLYDIFTYIYISIVSFVLPLHFNKIICKISEFKKNLVLYLCILSAIELYILCFSLFKFVSIFNINVQCLFICLCLLFLFHINYHIFDCIGFYSEGFISIFIFSHCRIVIIWSFFVLQSVQLPYPQSSISFRGNHWYLNILVFNGQPNMMFYHLYLCFF